MSSFTNPVDIKRGTPTSNVLAGSSKVSGMIGHGVAVAGKIALKELKTFFSLADAEAAGVTSGGVNNMAWYHIKEFYRKSGKGVKLYFMLADNSHTTGTLAVKMIDLINDTNSEYAKKMLIEAEGSIYNLGFFMAPAAGYTAVALNAMDSDSYNSIAAAQTLYNWADDRNLACNIVIEGRDFTGTSGTSIDLRAISNVKAHKVSLVVGQDYNYAEALSQAEHKKHAAVGTFLGSMSLAEVSQNVGENEEPDLAINDSTNFTVPGLSNHTKAKDRFADLDTLDTKAYLFVSTVSASIGVRWNGDHTCTPIEVDTDGNMSESTISMGRVSDEIRRRLRARLLPKIKTRQRIDPASGKLDPKTVAAFNALGDDVFDDMEDEGHISGGITKVDPNSNLSVQPRILKVNYQYVPIGQIDRIQGVLNIKNQLS
jgi:Protein of unknown function (DUF2586)